MSLSSGSVTHTPAQRFSAVNPGTVLQVYERSRTLGQTAREGRLQYLYQEGIT